MNETICGYSSTVRIVDGEMETSCRFTAHSKTGVRFPTAAIISHLVCLLYFSVRREPTFGAYKSWNGKELQFGFPKIFKKILTIAE